MGSHQAQAGMHKKSVHLLGWAFRLRPLRMMHRDWRGAPEEVQRRSIGSSWLHAEGPRVTSRIARSGMYDMLWVVQHRKQHTCVRCNLRLQVQQEF